MGGTNISPEVLKMLQQMAPVAPIEKEDELDEIKVPRNHDRRLTTDLLCFTHSFTTISIRRRTRSSSVPSDLP